MVRAGETGVGGDVGLGGQQRLGDLGETLGEGVGHPLQMRPSGLFGLRLTS